MGNGSANQKQRNVFLVVLLLAASVLTAPRIYADTSTRAAVPNAQEQTVSTTQLTVEVSGPIAQINSAAWTEPPSNVAFAVTSPAGRTIWYQATKDTDGSWSSLEDLGADFNSFGTYRFSVWATIAGKTASYETTTAEIAQPTVSSLEATWEGPVASLRASGWTNAPSNVAFELVSPAKRVSWHQAYRQSDGSWTSSAKAMTGSGDWGSYRVNVWATIGRKTYKVKSIETHVSKPEAKLSVASNEKSLTLTAGEWTVSPDNVAFEVVYPNKSVQWLQGKKTVDGAWANDLATTLYGTYEVRAWASYGVVTLSVASATATHIDPIARGVQLDIEADKLGFDATVSNFPTSAKNVAFEVTSASGKTKWIQARRSESDAWTATVNVSQAFGTWGAFSIKAWATIGSKTIPVGSSSSAVSKPTMDFSATSDQLDRVDIIARSWSSSPDNVAFQIIAPNNRSYWYQALKQGDGSWTLDLSLAREVGAWGSYRIVAWASFGSNTETYASQAIETSKPSITLAVNGGSEGYTFSTSAWTIEPSNVAFEVIAPSGTSRWYQAAKQANGSWSGHANAFNDLKEWGSYRVTAWATFAKSTERYASVNTAPIAGVSVRYSAATVTNRWVEARDGAQVSGWDGSAAQRLNRLCIALDSAPVKGVIKYQALTPTSGWSAWQQDGAVAGAASREGICAIRIMATDELASYCDIWYRVFSIEYGTWLGWTKNGAVAGSQRTPLDIEAIEIVARPKGASAPGSTANSELLNYPGTYPLTSEQKRVLASCNRTPSPGGGLCAAWVSNVFVNAGFGFWGGDARDMYSMYCFDSNLNNLRPGMIIAVPSHPFTYLGSIYGHIGIYIGQGKIMENVGHIQTSNLFDWIAHYGATRTVKWGWLGNKPLQ